MTDQTRYFLIAVAVGLALVASGLFARNGGILTAIGLLVVVGGGIGAAVSALVSETRRR